MFAAFVGWLTFIRKGGEYYAGELKTCQPKKPQAKLLQKRRLPKEKKLLRPLSQRERAPKRSVRLRSVRTLRKRYKRHSRYLKQFETRTTETLGLRKTLRKLRLALPRPAISFSILLRL
jgi:hypothetical protein